LLVPSPGAARIPLGQLTRIEATTGFAQILREDNQRRVAVKWSVRGRDMGSMVAEAQQKVAAAVELPEGYRMVWSGRFEDQRRAMQRLGRILAAGVPFTVLFLCGGVHSLRCYYLSLLYRS